MKLMWRVTKETLILILILKFVHSNNMKHFPLVIILTVLAIETTVDAAPKPDALESSSGTYGWTHIAREALCRTSGRPLEGKASAVLHSLKNFDIESNWIVFVYRTGDEAPYKTGIDWEVRQLTNLCGNRYNLLVLKKSKYEIPPCTRDLDGWIYPLVQEAAEYGRGNYYAVLNYILENEYMYELSHHVIIAHSAGDLATWNYDDCQSHLQYGTSVDVFYYGFSTSNKNR